MDILKTIRERRSIRSFKKHEVDHDILEQIFTYGSFAPTHYMKESWRIKMYQEDGKKFFIDAVMASYQRIGMVKDNNEPKTLQMIKSMKEFLMNIPHHAVIYFEREEDPIRYEEEYASVSAFIQNCQLAAWEYGVGMLWTITPYMHDAEFLRDIGLDGERMKIVGVLQIGYPEVISRNKGRTPIDEKLEIIKS
ncbi:nitroreductase [Oceanobacillus massiliensis]|uniref:nitroreductase family protein n=1 Tax=Oceanobacillus massiliensis TaxID=1465765 RepID=UPI003015EBAF